MTGRIAADIGGTFTDIAFLGPDGQLATRKVPSTPDDYSRAVIDGVAELLKEVCCSAGDLGAVLHASTIATNAILEGKGATTALVTTKGFRDVLELRRIRVPRLYEPLYEKPPPLVPRRLRFEVGERLGPDGEVILAIDEDDLDDVISNIRAAGAEAVAVCLLHSYANDAHERRIGDKLRARLEDAFVCLSVDVLPMVREYERTSTTVINAYVGPPVRRYLGRLLEGLRALGHDGPVLMMQSSGGIMDVEVILEKAALIVESGPAAGAIGAARVAAASGLRDAITLDMGGTTAKAALIEQGSLARTDEYEVGGGISLSSRLVKGGGYALRLPVIDISEVGAGGGSIAWIDPAGSLRVGPHSMGAVPGPACYATGGDEPTVTDANVCLGYLSPHSLAGGAIPIDANRARRAVERGIASPLNLSWLEAAYGIHEIANATMMRAVKAVSTYRGRDPRDFSIIAFGGNGGVHGAAIARLLGVSHVLVPPAAGVFSALGLLLADLEAREAQALLEPLDGVEPARLAEAYVALESRVRKQIGSGTAIRFGRAADLRYAGQAFEITVPMAEGEIGADSIRRLGEAFEAEYRNTYGHGLPAGSPIQLVGVRLVGTAEGDDGTPFDPAHLVTKRPQSPPGSRPVCFDPRVGPVETPVLARADLLEGERRGPVIIEEYEGTVVVPPDARARLDTRANIVIEIDGATRGAIV